MIGGGGDARADAVEGGGGGDGGGRAATGDAATTAGGGAVGFGAYGGVDPAVTAMFHHQQMMMVNRDAMRLAMERSAALAAMGPRALAQYAAYLAYARQSQASMTMMPDRGMMFMGPGYPYGGLVYGAEATSSMNDGKGGKSRKRTADRGAPSARDDGQKRAKRARATPRPKSKEAKTCVNCKSTDTPFWRKAKDGVGSLCNACGLYQAKNAAPRPALLWKKPGASASEDVTNNSEKTTEGVPSAENENDPAPEKESESVDALAGGTSDEKVDSGNSE